MTRHADRIRLAAATASALVLLVSGCGDEDGDEPTGPTVNLVSAEQVGGDVLPTAETAITTASPCNLDGSDQWVGASDQNSQAFEREADGATELVVVGVIEREADYVHEGLQSLRQRLASPDCRSGESDPPTDRWTSEPVTGLGPDTVAFRSVVEIGPGDAASEEDAAAEGRHSYLRAYRQAGDHMILVWLEREGDTDPSVDDLRRLLDEQTALTNKDA